MLLHSICAILQLLGKNSKLGYSMMGQSMEKSPKAKDIKIEAISYLMRDYMK